MTVTLLICACVIVSMACGFIFGRAYEVGRKVEREFPIWREKMRNAAMSSTFAKAAIDLPRSQWGRVL